MEILEKINQYLWGIPVLILIMAVGLILSFRTGFVQIRLFPNAFRALIESFKARKCGKDCVSDYRALCTALAATVGTGNIAGVAGAIALGGPGVIFWMWICALLGMIIKLSEVVLAVKYRQKNREGEYIGGPMYMIVNGLPKKLGFLAVAYSFFGIVASLGVGNATQVNAVTDGIVTIGTMVGFNFGNNEKVLIGMIIAVIILVGFFHGFRFISNWTEKLIPVAASGYILLSLMVIILKFPAVPDAFDAILRGAIHPKSITCGTICSAFMTLRIGITRGVFTNEAGMGTASIAHSATSQECPVNQGLLGIMEVFLDTVVICTLTALVILCSGIQIPYGTDPGISLTLSAFTSVCGKWSSILLTLLICLFAFATILGWGVYGARCAQFLFGVKAWRYFAILQASAAIIGTILETSVVWIFADIVNGLMALPNLIALFILMPQFIYEINKKQSVKV